MSPTRENDRDNLRDLDPAALKTVAECIAAQEALIAATIRIEAQLGHRRDALAVDVKWEDNPANPQWFRNAQFAKRMLGQKAQAVQTRRGELARAERAVKQFNNYPQRFVDAAKLELDAETIARIVARMKNTL
jgi:hypothetical protein